MIEQCGQFMRWDCCQLDRLFACIFAAEMGVFRARAGVTDGRTDGRCKAHCCSIQDGSSIGVKVGRNLRNEACKKASCLRAMKEVEERVGA